MGFLLLFRETLGKYRHYYTNIYKQTMPKINMELDKSGRQELRNSYKHEVIIGTACEKELRGIGMTRKEGQLALKVNFVIAPEIPLDETYLFRGVEYPVVVDVVGEIKAAIRANPYIP